MIKAKQSVITIPSIPTAWGKANKLKQIEGEREPKAEANFVIAWATKFASLLTQQKSQDKKSLLLSPMLSIREPINHGVTDLFPIASKHSLASPSITI